jgi:hypothetical protein
MNVLLAEAHVGQLAVPIRVQHYIFTLEVAIKNRERMEIPESEGDLCNVESTSGLCKASRPRQMEEEVASRAKVHHQVPGPS